MRSFIAIEIPPQVKRSLVLIQDKLKLKLPKVNWTKEDNLHITLRFLGEVADEKIGEIMGAIDAAARSACGFKLQFDCLGVFPEISRARIIWIGSHQEDRELKKVAAELDLGLVKLGFPKEDRPFSNHLTIGRIKDQAEAFLIKKAFASSTELIVKENLEFNPEGITLFKSTLGSQSPAYTPLGRVKF